MVQPGLSETVLRERLRLRSYTLETRLGRGATASVFVIRHRTLGKEFALKLIHPENLSTPGYVDRLRQEARVLGRLVSPHIVEVVDLWFEEDGTPFLVLELLQGRSLASELEARGRLTAEETVAWTIELLFGLAAAHAQGMVHRDLKPENLFLHQLADEGRILKILDFGLARILPSSDGRRALRSDISTSTGSLVGTPNYMSPEALRGERLDARTDVYGVGLVMFELLTGYGPFELGEEVAPSVRVLRPELDASLARVVDAALAEDPAARPSVEEFFAELLPLSSKEVE